MTGLQLPGPWRVGDLHSIFTVPESAASASCDCLWNGTWKRNGNTCGSTFKSDDNVGNMAFNPADLKDKAKAQKYDAALFPITFPDADQTFDLFEKLNDTDNSRRGVPQSSQISKIRIRRRETTHQQTRSRRRSRRCSKRPQRSPKTPAVMTIRRS